MISTWTEALAAEFINDDEALARVLEGMAPVELLSLHRATHHIAIEAARARRRKIAEAEGAKS